MTAPTIHRALAHDLPRIARFHACVGGNDRLTAEVLEYEYNRNPEPGGGLFFAQDSDKAVVACFGVIPQRLRYGSLDVLALMSERVLCHPRYRSTGLVAGLVEEALSQAQVTYDHVWGRTLSARALRNAAMTGTQCWVNYVKSASPCPGSRELTIATVRVEEGVELVARVQQSHPSFLHMAYSAAKLCWMYRDNPFVTFSMLGVHRRSELAAFVIVRHGSNSVAKIDELFASPYVDLAAALSVIEDRLFRDGHARVRVAMNDACSLQRNLASLLLRSGYRRTRAAEYVVRRGDAAATRKFVAQANLTGGWAPPFWAPPTRHQHGQP